MKIPSTEHFFKTYRPIFNKGQAIGTPEEEIKFCQLYLEKTNSKYRIIYDEDYNITITYLGKPVEE